MGHHKHKVHRGVVFHGEDIYGTFGCTRGGIYAADLMQNHDIYIAYSAGPTCIQCPTGGPRRNFVKIFSTGKTRMIWLLYAKESMMICKAVRYDTWTWQTDGRSVGRTDRQSCYINIAHQHCCSDAITMWKFRTRPLNMPKYQHCCYT